MIEVSCAIIVENKQVLVTQRSESMPHSLKWEFPGGKLKEGETPELCIRREIREELGLIVEVERLLRCTQHSYDAYTIKLFPFICRIREGSIKLSEHKTFRWIDLDKLEELDWLDADVEVVRMIMELFSR